MDSEGEYDPVVAAALISAAASGDVDQVRSLIEELPCEALLEESSSRAGGTALHVACRGRSEDHIAAARLLLEKAPTKVLEMTDAQNSTPMYIAATKGHRELVELMMERSSIQALSNGLSVARAIVGNGWPEVLAKIPLELLLEPMVYVHSRSCLHFAAASSDVSLGTILDRLEDSFDLRGHCDSQGKSILSVAASSGNKECVELILDRCSPKLVTQTDSDGLTPLANACMAGGREEIIEMLLERMTDEEVSMRNYFGNVLHVCRTGNAMRILPRMLPEALEAEGETGQKPILTIMGAETENSCLALMDMLTDEQLLPMYQHGVNLLQMAIQREFYRAAAVLARRLPVEYLMHEDHTKKIPLFHLMRAAGRGPGAFEAIKVLAARLPYHVLTTRGTLGQSFKDMAERYPHLREAFNPRTKGAM